MVDNVTSMDEQAEVVRGIELPEHLRLIRQPIPRPLRHLARAGFRGYGMATASWRPAPDFLVIGAKKAGTSSLINWLMSHPAVARPFPHMQGLKSPHYFDINYWRGARWYRSHFPSARSRHRQQRRVGADTVVGEASPYYMFHPAVPGRVARDLPHVKLIISLRDPVARAYSNYWDRVAAGTELIESFEAAIAAESSRLDTVDASRLLSDPHYYSAHHDNHTYLARGRYVEHVASWLERFPRRQVLVVRAEDMFDDPVVTFLEVQRFLGLPALERSSLRTYNQRRRPPIDPDTRAWLADYYRPYNAALYAAIGRDMQWEATYPG